MKKLIYHNKYSVNPAWLEFCRRVYPVKRKLHNKAKLSSPQMRGSRLLEIQNKPNLSLNSGLLALECFAKQSQISAFSIQKQGLQKKRTHFLLWTLDSLLWSIYKTNPIDRRRRVIPAGACPRAERRKPGSRAIMLGLSKMQNKANLNNLLISCKEKYKKKQNEPKSSLRGNMVLQITPIGSTLMI
jgi:hypothetical protein